ncbi:MAG: HAD hydrolase-like protein [Candidatus Aenigmarchaeota archaeon]|nr:HAD hydrolase-like protein [Candidatus Aenigmarchaeota archaeon]
MAKNKSILSTYRESIAEADCFLIDMNGTIRDELPAVYRSIVDVFLSFGRKPPTLADYRSFEGSHYWDHYLKHGFQQSERADVDRLFRQFFDSRYAHMVSAFPDAVPTITELKARKKVVGIVSNIPRSRLDMHMHEYGLDRIVDLSVSAEDVDEMKPSPKPLEYAFQTLGVPPEKGCYTGDKTWDVSVARATKTTSIAISRRGSYHTRDMLEKANPDVLINRLAGLLYI